MTGRRSTSRGRIVYNRPRHFFNARDLLRVARAMPPPETVGDAIARLLAVAAIFSDVIASIVAASSGFLASSAFSTIVNVLLGFIDILIQQSGLESVKIETLFKIRNLIASL
jgi:hypothetical protein